jgi:2-polyprenyl-3-methyl-5-hydroxy-6-metoxy-1,4-benzoquinol methylase
MSKEYYSFTSYSDVEDLKRLNFIVSQVESLGKKGAKVIDIGCGNGNISLALGSLGYDVYGVDIDANSIANARQKNTFKQVKFDVLDVSLLQLGEKFDVVVCSEVLEHLEQPDKMVATIAGILDTNGLFVATVPNGFGPREVLITRPMQWLTARKLDKGITAFKKLLGYNATTLQSSNEDLTHIHFFTFSALQKMMVNAGFAKYNYQNGDFLERIFPISLFTKRFKWLQRLDCWIIDFLPRQLSGGFYTSWRKK